VFESSTLKNKQQLGLFCKAVNLQTYPYDYDIEKIELTSIAQLLKSNGYSTVS